MFIHVSTDKEPTPRTGRVATRFTFDHVYPFNADW
jgi:hypothetical protein